MKYRTIAALAMLSLMTTFIDAAADANAQTAGVTEALLESRLWCSKSSTEYFRLHFLPGRVGVSDYHPYKIEVWELANGSTSATPKSQNGFYWQLRPNFPNPNDITLSIWTGQIKNYTVQADHPSNAQENPAIKFFNQQNGANGSWTSDSECLNKTPAF